MRIIKDHIGLNQVRADGELASEFGEPEPAGAVGFCNLERCQRQYGFKNIKNIPAIAAMALNNCFQRLTWMEKLMMMTLNFLLSTPLIPLW